MKSSLHPKLIRLEQDFKPSPITRIVDAELDRCKVELWIKRDDLIHPIVSGNKWRKLKYTINNALHQNAECIISMGGQYSNHLHALAFASKALGLKSSAIIRGEKPTQFTPTLLDLEQWGMELNFISRQDYRLLRHIKVINDLPQIKTGQYWIPEGGATNLALKGISESINEIDMDYDLMAVACGTGTTLAGLIANGIESRHFLGIATIKNAGFLVHDVQELLNSEGIKRENWQIGLDYHFGGFAKTKPALLDFVNQFRHKHQIPIEPVYTGKLLFAIYDLLRLGYFKPGQRIIALHTGGLQGMRQNL